MAKVGCCKRTSCHVVMGVVGTCLLTVGAVFIGLHLPQQWIDDELDKVCLLMICCNFILIAFGCLCV